MLFYWKVSLTIGLLYTCIEPSTTSLVDFLDNSADSKLRTVEYLSQLIFSNSELRTTVGVWKHAERKSHNQFYADLLDALLPKSKYTVMDWPLGYNPHYETAIHLYLIDSARTLCQLFREGRPKGSSSTRKTMFLIVLPPRVEDPMSIVTEMLALCWNSHILDVNILVQDENGVINSYTYCPFEPGSCNSMTPILLGHYNGGPLNVSLQSLFPFKLRNFWKCPLRVVVWRNAPFIIFNHTRHGRIEPLAGIDGMILVMLSRALNLTLNIIPLARNNSVLHETVVATKIQRALRENKADLAIGNLRCTLQASSVLSLSDAYFISKMRIIIRPPDPYSSLEMLFLPFDIYCWTIIIVYFGGRRLCNLAARRFSRRSLGTGQMIPRFLLLIYLLSYNVIRGAYEGSVFKFLHQKPERHLPANLEEGISQGYKFLVDIETYLSMEPTAELNKSLIVINITEKMLMSQMKYHPGKIGMLFLEDYAVSFLTLREEYSKFYLVKQIFSSKLACVYVPKYSNLIGYLNKRLMQFRTHGLIQKFYSDYRSTRVLRIRRGHDKKAAMQPSALGIDDMKGVWQVYAVLISFCTIVLLAEMVSRRYRRIRRFLDYFH